MLGADGLTIGVIGHLGGGLRVGGLLLLEHVLVLGLAWHWQRQVWHRYIVAGTLGVAVCDLVVGLAIGLVPELPDSVALSALGAAAFFLAYVVADHMADPWPAAVASGVQGVLWGTLIAVANRAPVTPVVGSALLATVATLSASAGGLSGVWWTPRLLALVGTIWNGVLYRLEVRRIGAPTSLVRWQSAFWAAWQPWPPRALVQHLLFALEHHPLEGQKALSYMDTLAQRGTVWAAQVVRAVQFAQDVRRWASCTDVDAVRAIHHSMPPEALGGEVNALLRAFYRLSYDVDAALHQTSLYHRRLALGDIEERLDGLERELRRTATTAALQCLPVATRWCQLVAAYAHRLAAEVAQRQEIPSPYVVGVPLWHPHALFVGRADISTRLEHLLQQPACPPLLLYGQRRVGKTSLLRHLGQLLPSHVVPLYVDLQGPATRAPDHAGLLYNLARGMVEAARQQRGLALPALPRAELNADPFTRFDEWLDAVEQILATHTALLALDEFEALSGAFVRGRFVADEVLGMLRSLSQHRSRFKLILAGSHILEEVQPWARYLVHVPVVSIGYLEEGAARQLIERPIDDFPLRYTPTASRRVLEVTRRHPFLVQLLCAEIVAVKNAQPLARRHHACLADVEAAVPQALRSGRLFFASLEYDELDADGRALLRGLAAHGAGAVVPRETLARQCPTDLDQALVLPLQRELLEAVGTGYRFQVELIQRWFAAPGHAHTPGPPEHP